MANETNPEYEAAKSRISTLLGQIREQIQAIDTSDCVDGVIAEQDKSGFIFKQTELINAYRDRDVNDPRDAYITELEEKNAELEERLANAEKRAKNESDRWYKMYQINKHLRTALISLTAVLEHEQG